MNPLLAAVLLLAATPQERDEAQRFPPKPGPREYIVDKAQVLKSDDVVEIRILCDEVLSKKQAPIVVLTIPSLASVGASAWPIERYAMNLMAEWGVGWPEWNYGMLLLVSIGDRKARIELGGSWERRKDDDAKRIMAERIIPYFKKGETSKGILEGVRGLHDLALDRVPSRSESRRGTPVPPPRTVPGLPSSGGAGCLPGLSCGMIAVIVVAIVGIMLVSRLFRRGTVTSWGQRGPYGGYYGGGYGGGFGSSFGGGLLGGALGSMLGNAMSHRDAPPAPPPSYGGGDTSSSSGDFGGGSFGGGFSGGGGATGEW